MRIRRNAFAIGKKEDVSPEPPTPTPLEEAFGIITSSGDSVAIDQIEDEDRACPHLTNEQITGKITRAAVTRASFIFLRRSRNLMKKWRVSSSH